MSSLVSCCGAGEVMPLDLWATVFGRRSSAKEEQDCAPCDPAHCAMKGGICIDCTKCSRHCACEQEDDIPTTAMTPRQKVSGEKGNEDEESSQASGEATVDDSVDTSSKYSA